jgi:YD repeat-containing protein
VVSDPIDVSDGNAYYEETDYAGSGTNPLTFQLSANALINPVAYWNGGLSKFPVVAEYSGIGWSASYFQSLVPVAVTDSTGVLRSAVYAFRPDGRILEFNLYNGVYSPDGDTADSLMQTSTGWEYQTANDTIETYNTSGQLVTVAVRGQAPVTVSYASVGDPPSSVSDAFGHTLTLHYIVDGSSTERLGSITDPNGSTISYAYDSTGNLSSETFQDGSSRHYAYSTGAFSHSLATVTDESGNAYESWTYLTSDVQQRVGHSSFAGGVGAYSFAYATTPTGGSVSVTDPLGKVRTFSQQPIWGTYRMTGSSAVCAGCDSARGYDANGNITSRADFNGDQTVYSYDDTRNLETSRTEAYGTSVARTISTTWDANWRQPDLIAEPNRSTAFTYDSMGNVLTKVVTDTTTSTSRTWTYTYDTYGRVLTAKGPRTDLNSTTTYAYYTCTTGVQCGQVNTVTDAVGNVRLVRFS